MIAERPRIRRIAQENAPPDSSKKDRERLATLIERLRWLGDRIAVATPGGTDSFRAAEYAALRWLLVKAAGEVLVTRWVWIFEIKAPPEDRACSSRQKEE